MSARSPHVGEMLMFCEASGWFESPVHGEKFDRYGRYAVGPAPHGMDRFPVLVVAGVIHVQRGARIEGPPQGTEYLPPEGRSCVES